MSVVMDLFKTICSLPHCSRQAESLKEYIIKQAKAYGYEIGRAHV